MFAAWLVAIAVPAAAAGAGQTSSRLPTFSRPVFYKTFASDSAVAIGDLNGDRKADLAVANLGGSSQGSPGAVTVLLNRGGGRLQASRTYQTDKGSDIVISDLNGDAKPDVAIVGDESFSIIVFINKGDGTLGPARSYPVGNLDTDNVAVALAAGDLNGDGRPDLVTADPNFSGGREAVSVLINRGDGSFGQDVEYAVPGGAPLSVAVADLNGDGHLDVAVASDSVSIPGNGSVSVLLGKGDGTLQQAHAYRASGRSTYVAVGDVNGDRKPDLVTPNQLGNSVSVLLNKGDGSFRARRTYRVTAACLNKVCAPQSVQIGDLNGDGKPDLAVGNHAAPIFTALLNSGHGTFNVRRDYRIRGQEAAFFKLGDLNGDGKLDVAVAESGGVTVLLNTTRR
jgi:hypothetical protein